MRSIDLIIKKRNGEALSAEEISFLVRAFVSGEVTDYQMAAFAMAVYFQGMTPQETAQLATAMAKSGDTVNLSPIPGKKVDKHSTGGVADTTTLIVAPLVAAAGVPVAKMSGRGLGHTGGTIDKLESIPGFNTSLEREEFIAQVRTIKAAIAGQSGNLVPADKKLYALRDVTGTVESLPLIASSIMSKKIATGSDAIVLDVKTGTGALMKQKDEAVQLALMMVAIGQEVGRETVAVISDMNEPLGDAIGNALEVKEAILTLQGKKRGRLRELSLYLASQMLLLAGAAGDLSEAQKILAGLLDSGKALVKFREMISAQGGKAEVTDDISLLPEARSSETIGCWEDGWLSVDDAGALGTAAMLLGAGRKKKDESIDLAVGVVMHARNGDILKKGEPLLTMYCNDASKLGQANAVIRKAVSFSPRPVKPRPLLYGLVTKEGYQELAKS